MKDFIANLVKPESPLSRIIFRKRRSEESILLILCALSLPSILPFAIYRIQNREWLLGATDCLIVLGVSLVMGYVFVTGKTHPANLIVSIFYSIGMLLVVYLKGPSLIYWTYPTMTAGFFILRPKVALTINSCSLLAIIFILRSSIPDLQLGSIIITLALINLFAYIFSYGTQIQHKELNLEAERDFLTGVGNRRALEKQLFSCTKASRREIAHSILLIDVDFFKRINDEFGHSIGDAVLKEICRLIRMRVRASDQIFRYGGEEFIVLAHSANLTAASRVAEDLRSSIEHASIIAGCKVTVSIGVASLNNSEESEEWLARADKMLYLAKNSGRNRVVFD